MRKNDDGYVLPFVLVVMIVLCIISASLMTASLRNLQMQQKFTARMVDKYEAQGEIEKAVAQLKQDVVIEGNATDTLTPRELSEKLGETIEVTQEGDTIGEDTAIEAGRPFDFTVSLNVSSEATTIACELLILAQYESAQENQASTYKHTITVETITYKSYEISTGGGT